MTLQECYIALEGNYDDVIGRLRSERMVQKYVLKFLEDPNFDVLCRSLELGNLEEAFRAAHTIKGMCQNLSFTKLQLSDSMVTEKLRSGDLDGARALLDLVRRDYECTVNAISIFRSGLSGE